MITGIVFLLILVAVYLRGGDLSKMATVRPQHAWTVAAAILIQVAIISLFASEMPFAVASGLHLASYGLTLVFFWVNRGISGIVMTVLGGVLNLIAIVANGGVMPASAAALEFAGKPLSTGEFENSTTQADANLAFLGDVFALPHGMPFANVFSIGDIILLVGSYVLVSRACMPTGAVAAEADEADKTASTAATGPIRERTVIPGQLPVSFDEALANWRARQGTPLGT